MNSFLFKTKIKKLLRFIGFRGNVPYSFKVLASPRRWRHELDIRNDFKEFSRLFPSFKEKKLVEGLKNKKRILFASLTSDFQQFKMELFLAKRLQLMGCEVIIANLRRGGHSEKYFKQIGIDKFLILEDFRDSKKSNELYESVNPDLISPPYQFDRFMDMKINGVHVGQHVVSTYLASSRKGRVELNSEGMRDYVSFMLRATIEDIPAVESLFDAAKADSVVFFEKGYLPWALFFDVALKRNLEVIQWNAAQKTDHYVFKRYSQTNRKNHPLSLSEESWALAQSAEWEVDYEKEVLNMLEQRYIKDDWYNRNQLRSKVSMRNPDEVKKILGLAPEKKTAVIYSHVLWDATFFFGENLFSDYSKWLLETVKVACANDRVNWIIKLHPDYLWKMKVHGKKIEEPDLFREFFGDLPSHVKIMLPESDINTYSVFKITDYCITVRGTVGIEMSCLGVPVLTAGTGRYSGKGFTNDSSSAAEYLDKLRNIESIPSMTANQKRLARLFAHTLYNFRPIKLYTINTHFWGGGYAKHPLFINYTYNLKSVDDLIKAADISNICNWIVNSNLPDFLTTFPMILNQTQTAFG